MSEAEDLRKKIVGKKIKAPNFLEFAQELIQAFGGPRRLSRMILAELKTASTPMVRAKMLELVVNALKIASTSLSMTDLDMLTDEDLLREWTQVKDEIEGEDQEERGDAGGDGLHGPQGEADPGDDGEEEDRES